MPPSSIVIASIWLASVSLYGLFRFIAEYFSSSQNPFQTGWFAWIALLGLANISSIAIFFLQRPRAQIYYFGSLTLLFVSGTIFYAVLGRSGQQAGAFGAQCISAALIFMIAYLPYRDRFEKK